MKEIWKPVVGWEGWYSISNFGRIRRDRAATGATVGQILRTRFLGDRPTAYFRRGGRGFNRRVAHLVLEAFIGPRPKGYISRHLDDFCWNNRVENLSWGTYSQNLEDRRKNGIVWGFAKISIQRRREISRKGILARSRLKISL